MSFPNIHNVRDLSNWLESEKIPYSSLGNTAMGDPILMIHKEGVGDPVLITSGAHAGEPAGVFAAMTILKNWKYKNPLYMVPLRDPFGFQGYEACLSHAMGREMHFETHGELWKILKENCTELLYEDDTFLLVDMNGILLTNQIRPEKIVGPRGVELKVNAVLAEHPELIGKCAGKRIVFPSNAGDAENVWDFYRAFSAEITAKGIVADMNRRFGTQEEPNEVKFLRQLCDEIKPPVVLDLHEGQGSSYYFFVPDYNKNPAIAHYTRLMRDAIIAHGKPITTLDDVAKRLGNHMLEQFVEPVPGVLVDAGLSAKQGGSGFSSYAGKYGASITIECGRWAPLEDRVNIHLWAAEAMLNDMSSSTT